MFPGSARASGAEDDVGDIGTRAPGRPNAIALTADLDRPTIAEVVLDVCGPDVVGGVEAGRAVAIVSVEAVVHEEERAAGSDRAEDLSDGVVIGGYGGSPST